MGGAHEVLDLRGKHAPDGLEEQPPAAQLRMLLQRCALVPRQQCHVAELIQPQQAVEIYELRFTIVESQGFPGARLEFAPRKS